MRIDRLKILAKYLKTIPEKNLYMYIWASGNRKNLTCKTAGCALGWATQIPEFKKDGLNLFRDRDFGLIPTYKNREDYDAAQAFFEITPAQALNLFSPSFYDFDPITPADVISRINKLIASKS